MPPSNELDRRQRRRAERSRRATARRRRLAVIGLGAIAAAAGVAVGAGSEPDPGSSPEGGSAARPGEPPAPQCPHEIAGDPRRLVGQMLIVRMEATATEGLRERLRQGEIGGVILFPPAGTDLEALGRQVQALRSAASRAGAPAPLVMIDQEGGEVERLPELPPDGSAPQLAAEGVARAREQGRATGAALARLGIDVDLAPVLDLPAIPDAFIASRAFGADAATVAEVGVGFGEGLEAAGVAATAKHFPGLGAASVNTDLAPSTVTASRAELDPGLKPFEAAIDAGFGLVMVANATYAALDPERPASLSPRVVGDLLRRRLGFDGVVVTDDLGAGALTAAGLGEADAAVGAARAGADLLLFALSDAKAAHAALLRALRRGELEREALLASCLRTTALRELLAAAR